jgi:hypothetical protein
LTHLRASAPIRSKKCGGLHNFQGRRTFCGRIMHCPAACAHFFTELFLVIFPFPSSTLLRAAEDFVM